jgi:hypothetical protein
MKHSSLYNKDLDCVEIKTFDSINKKSFIDFEQILVKETADNKTNKAIIDQSSSQIDLDLYQYTGIAEQIAHQISSDRLYIALVHSLTDNNRDFAKNLKTLFDISYLNNKNSVIISIFSDPQKARAWITNPSPSI